MKTSKRIPTTATELLDWLEWQEVLPGAPDRRQVLMQERFALASALRSGDPAQIRTARDDAIRVASMWAP